ncbi:MAG: AAA family ATPase [Polyangiales bacterium]
MARGDDDIVLAFGLENPDGRDTTEAARAVSRIRPSVTLPPGARLGFGLHPARLLFDADRQPHQSGFLDEALAAVRALAERGDEALLATAGAEPQLRELYELARRDGGVLAVLGDRGAVRRRVVGRKEVFRQFGEILAKAANKGLQVVLVQGEAGVGKSRAVEEIHYRLRRMNHPVTWYMATCVSHDRDVPLSGLQALLRELLGIDESDDEASMREKARRVRELGLTPDEMLAVGVVLGVVSASMESLDSASRPLRSALRKIATRLGEDQITVFAWDAAEHMDELSANLVNDLIRNAPRSRVVVLLSGRAGRERPWDDLPHRSVIALGPLSEDESRALVMQTLALTASPPADLLDELWARASGNPLALEEYLKAFVDAGAVQVADGAATWRRESVRAEVPKTLRGVVASRLASLGAAERRVLQVASVIGSRVFRPQLAETVSMRDAQLDAALAALTERGLLRDEGDGEWRFASEILLDAVYDSLTLETRKTLHAAVVAVTERVFHARLDEFAERLAHHWWEGGDRVKAAQYLERAARRQLRDRAPDAAVVTLGRALDRMLASARPDPAQVIAAYELLGEAGLHASNVDAAVERLRLAAPYAEEVGDRAALARLLTVHGRLLARRQHMSEAVRVLERALALADLLSERALRGRVVSTLGAVHVERGEFGKALRHLEEAVRIAKDAGLEAEHARALLSLSRAQAASGDRVAATASLDEAELTASRDEHDPTLSAEIARTRAEVLLLARDLPAALREADLAVEQAREQHRAVELCAALVTLGEACWRVSDGPRAFAVFNEARDLAERRGFTRLATRCEAFIAFLEGSREGGDGAAASARIETAQAALESEGFLADAIETRYLLGLLAIRSGDGERARRLLREALTKAGAAENRAYIEDCDLALRGLSTARR